MKHSRLLYFTSLILLSIYALSFHALSFSHQKISAAGFVTPSETAESLEKGITYHKFLYPESDVYFKYTSPSGRKTVVTINSGSHSSPSVSLNDESMKELPYKIKYKEVSKESKETVTSEITSETYATVTENFKGPLNESNGILDNNIFKCNVPGFLNNSNSLTLTFSNKGTSYIHISNKSTEPLNYTLKIKTNTEGHANQNSSHHSSPSHNSPGHNSTSHSSTSHSSSGISDKEFSESSSKNDIEKIPLGNLKNKDKHHNKDKHSDKKKNGKEENKKKIYDKEKNSQKINHKKLSDKEKNEQKINHKKLSDKKNKPDNAVHNKISHENKKITQSTQVKSLKKHSDVRTKVRKKESTSFQKKSSEKSHANNKAVKSNKGNSLKKSNKSYEKYVLMPAFKNSFTILKVNESVKLSLYDRLTGKPISQKELASAAWASSNTSSATVIGGKISAHRKGTAIVSVKIGNNTAACTVRIL